MQRKVYSWDGARRCTICDSVTVRSARRRTAKNEWLPRGSLNHAAAGRFSPLGPQAPLPLINVKISGPHGVGQYLRRALSACFLDFDHYRCRVDFRLCLSARCGNVIESRPETINSDCCLQSKCLSRLPMSAAHASYSHHVDGNLGVLR